MRHPAKHLPQDRLPSREESSYEFQSVELLRKSTTGKRPMKGLIRGSIHCPRQLRHWRLLMEDQFLRPDPWKARHAFHNPALEPASECRPEKRHSMLNGVQPAEDVQRCPQSCRAVEGCLYPAVPRLLSSAGLPGRVASGQRRPVLPALKRRAMQKGSYRLVV